MGPLSITQLAQNSQAVFIGLGAASKILETIDRVSKRKPSSILLHCGHRVNYPAVTRAKVPPMDSEDEGGRPEKVEGVITAENVDFWYPARPKVQVLNDFSAQFPRGKTTALVGASGSGKSTII